MCLYFRALADFRNDHGDEPEAYLAAVIDAALLLVNPGSRMCPIDDSDCHSDLWEFGAMVWSKILAFARTGCGISRDYIIDIVADTYEREFIGDAEVVRQMAAVDNEFIRMIRTEFGIGACPPTTRDLPEVGNLVALIAPHAEVVAGLWVR